MGFSLAGIKPRTRLPVVGGLLGVLYLPGLLGCGGVPPEVAVAKTDSVLFRGCRVLQKADAGTICLPSAISQTILWIADRPCDSIELAEDGTSVATSSKWVEGGCQLRPSERSTKQTSTYSIRERNSGKELWSLYYDRSKPWLLELTDRMWQRADPDLQAIVGIEPTVAVGIDEHPAVTVDRAYAAAVVLIRQGKIDQSLLALAEVQELAMRLGYPSVALDAAFRRMTTLIQAGLPEEAALVRNDIANQVLPGFAWAKILLSYYAGLFEYGNAHYLVAETNLYSAVVDAKRINESDLYRIYIPIWVSVLFELGRTEAAQAEIDTLPIEKLDSCVTADVLRQLGRAQVPLLELDFSGASPQKKPLTAELLLRRALDARSKCQSNTEEASIYTGLAEIAFLSGRIADASIAIEKAREKSALAIQDEMTLLEVESRIAHQNGDNKKALLLLNDLELLSSRYPNAERYLVRCKVVIGKLESSVGEKAADLSLETEARDCTNSVSLLLPQARARLTSRLQAIGYR